MATSQYRKGVVVPEKEKLDLNWEELDPSINDALVQSVGIFKATRIHPAETTVRLGESDLGLNGSFKVEKMHGAKVKLSLLSPNGDIVSEFWAEKGGLNLVGWAPISVAAVRWAGDW